MGFDIMIYLLGFFVFMALVLGGLVYVVSYIRARVQKTTIGDEVFKGLDEVTRKPK
jgi:hypothetical protein